MKTCAEPQCAATYAAAVLAAAIVVGVPAACTGAAQASDPLVLVFPADIDTAGVRIRYFMGGPFGGYGGVVMGKRGPREYRIGSGRDSQPATTLHAVVYTPGHAFQALDLTAQLTAPHRRVMLRPPLLATVALFGRVSPYQSGPHATRHVVTAEYYAWWECEFFGLPDCVMGPIEVGRAGLDPEGRFSMELPDFANDPTVALFSRPGEFAFRILDTATGNPLFSLRLQDEPGAMGRLAVSPVYADELVFSAEPWQQRAR